MTKYAKAGPLPWRSWGTTMVLALTPLAQALAASPAGAAAIAPLVPETGVVALEPVAVEGRFLGAATEHTAAYTTSVMSTTTGLALTPQETPQSVSVITRQQIDDLNLTRWEDALRQSTGINVIQDSGRYRFQSRGFYIDQIEEDGMSSTVPGASSNPYRSADSLNDLEIYDHIEILRGAAGLTQGNAEPGGTINAVRKRPTREFQARGSLALGSWRGRRGSVDLSGSLSPQQQVRGRVVAVGETGDSFKQSVERRHHTLYGVLEADLAPGSRLTVGGLHQRRRDTPDVFGLPLGNGGDLGLPTDTFLAADWSRNDFTKDNGFAELEQALGDDWTLTAKLNHNRTRSTQLFAGLASASTTFAGVADDGLLPMNNMQHYNNHGRQTSVQLNLHGIYGLLGRRHEAFVTLQSSTERMSSRWRRHMNSSRYDVWAFDPGQVSEPDWDDASILQNDITYDNRITQRALSLGTRLQLAEPLHVLLGGRYTRFSATGSYQYRTWAGQPDDEFGQDTPVRKTRFVPYAGVTYDLNEQHTLYASYTQIFKPQSVLDADGQVLEPVLGTNVEAGVKAAWFDGRMNASLAVFQITQSNRGLYDALTLSYVPEGKVRSRGYELEVAGELQPGWHLAAGYTFNLSKYLETESTRYPSGSNFSKHTPRHLLRLYTSYRLPGAWWRTSVGVGVNVQSDTSSLYDVRQGGYSLWNANVQHDVSQQLRLNLAVHNLTDKRYYENQRTRMNGINNFYGAPRSVWLRLDWMLK